MQEHQLPIQRACRVVRLSRAAYYRPPVSRARAGCVRHRGPDGRRRRPRPLGLLEVFRSTAAPGAPVESQAGASRVLRAAAQFAAADEAPRAAPAPTAARRAAAAESDVGARFHGRRYARDRFATASIRRSHCGPFVVS